MGHQSSRLVPATKLVGAAHAVGSEESAVGGRATEGLGHADALFRVSQGTLRLAAARQRLASIRICPADVVRVGDLFRDRQCEVQRRQRVGAAAFGRKIQAKRVASVPFDATRSDLAGDLDRRQADVTGLRAPIEQHEQLAVTRQDACLGRRGRLLVDRRHGSGRGDECLVRVSQVPQRSRQLGLQGRGSGRIGGGVHRGDRFAPPSHRPTRVTRQPGGLGGTTEERDPVHARDPLGVLDAGPCVQRLLVVPCRIGEGEVPLGSLAGPDGCLERPKLVAGRRPVERQLRPVPRRRDTRAGVLLGQCLGDGPVQAAALAGQQLLVGGLLEQGVPERVDVAAAWIGLDDEELVRDSAPQAIEQVCLVQPGHRGQQAVLHAPSRHGRGADHGLRKFWRGRQARHEDPAQGRWQRPALACRVTGHHQLLDEERIAIRSFVDPLGEARRRFLAEDPAEQRDRVRGVEALQVESLDSPTALELGQPRHQRVAAMQLVGAECQEQQHAVGTQVADDESDAVPRGRVGPVQVFHHQQHRLALGKALEQAQQGLEHPRLRRPEVTAGVRDGGRRQGWHQAGQVLAGRADDQG